MLGLEYPVSIIFLIKMVLLFSAEGIYEYSEDVIASEDVMATLAISDQLCVILGESLNTLGRPK